MPPPLRVMAVLLSVAVWIGMAVLAYGGLAGFLANPARVGVLVVMLVLGIAAPFAGGNLSKGQQEDRGNRWVIPVLAAIALAQGWLPPWCDGHDVVCLGGGAALRWIGVVLFAAGGALRLAPVFVLGDRFSGLVAIQPGHRLLTTGLYRTIRHPSYLGLLASSLGWGLAFRSWAGLALACLILIPLVARITAEEQLLAGHFGADYAAYRARTWRLLPGVW
jgi:protein-S-isoprenylcysteine O-methyltransferase Ste14